MSHAAIAFHASSGYRDALDGFFLTHATLVGVEEHDDGSVTFYIPQPEWNPAFEQSVQRFCGRYPDMEFLGADIIEDRNWNAEWEASVIPIQATPELVIAPSWKMHDAKKMEAKYLLTIDPKMSFGTGHHETTRLCLAAIEALEITGHTVLDIGTGSGVLAIYALLRGARKAVGLDTDAWAITNARENRELNHCSEGEFEIRNGTFDRIRKQELFDLVLANLHRNVLLEIVDQIHSHAAHNASVILSGILMYDADEIRAAYEKAKFKFVRELKENEWSCLVFRA